MEATLLLFFMMITKVKSHLLLTYPAARHPPFDFLDTFRTFSPCGIPRLPNATLTTFIVDRPYNLTWRMAYPHQGGYRLSLLDANGSLVQGLVPRQVEYGFAGLNDQTLEQSDLVIFTKPCFNCVVRIERQGLEMKYDFHSCADVNIIEKKATDSTLCSEAGQLIDEQCHCDPFRSGSICQYKVDCVADADCQNDGICVDESDAIIRRTCFCSFGFYGRNCENTFDRKNESEANECFNYQYDMASVESSSSAFDLYNLFKSDCYTKVELNKKDAIYYRSIENDTMEIILDYESTTWIALGWRPTDIDQSCLLFPSIPGRTRAEEERFARTQAADGISLHPMNCMDMIIASVLNGRLRIGDHYTRDRATPLLDSWFNGTDGLLGAFGIAQDGKTVIMFRRKISASEQSDHALDGKLFLVWAKGQEMGSYSHKPKSALEAEPVGDPIFYKKNVLKYHGKRNRGVRRVTFMEQAVKESSEEASFISGHYRTSVSSFLLVGLLFVQNLVTSSLNQP